jgi:hypothetical protein
MQHTKTAMQEMIENIKLLELKTTDQQQIYMLTHLKVGALILLQKEKEHIIDAYIEGYTSWDSEMTSLEYYTKTYKKKE